MSSKPTLVATGATFSPCRRYRYSLERVWDPARGRCVFVGFNPSTADAFEDDPTIRRCIDFAHRWGFGAFVMLNLYGIRSTDPKVIRGHEDPVGPGNFGALYLEASRAARLVVAWGALADPYPDHVDDVLETLNTSPGPEPMALGALTASGAPRHPLYLRKSVEPSPYPGPFS